MDADELAGRLAAARASGAPLEGAAPRLALEEGYRVAERLALRLGTVVGWKVGATSEGAQRALGVGEPIYGRLFEGRVFLGETVLPVTGERAVEVEPEVIVQTGAGGAIARLWVALEVNRPARDDALELGAGFVVADNAANWGLVLGSELPAAALEDPARLSVRLTRGDGVETEGSAAAVLGDPMAAVRWLAGKVELAPAMLVATGAMARSVTLAPGQAAVADFGVWGQLRVTRAP